MKDEDETKEQLVNDSLIAPTHYSIGSIESSVQARHGVAGGPSSLTIERANV